MKLYSQTRNKFSQNISENEPLRPLTKWFFWTSLTLFWLLGNTLKKYFRLHTKKNISKLRPWAKLSFSIQNTQKSKRWECFKNRVFWIEIRHFWHDLNFEFKKNVCKQKYIFKTLRDILEMCINVQKTTICHWTQRFEKYTL